MLALIYAGSFWLSVLSRFVNIPFGRELSSLPVQNAFGIGVAVTGLAGVFSSMMIYRDTRRTFWRMKFTSLQFTGNHGAAESGNDPVDDDIAVGVCAQLRRAARR
jgi:hypothetical protein